MLKITATIVALAIYAAVSTADYNDAARADTDYCAMVESGAWPAYRGPCNDR